MKRRTLVASEHEEQASLFDWAEIMSGRYPELKLLYAIPNGAHKSPAMAAKFKAEGLKAGVPDVCLPVARGGWHGLYIEMKRTKGGVTSAEQLKWMEALEEQGYFVALCAGWQEAQGHIEFYLRHKVEPL